MQRGLVEQRSHWRTIENDLSDYDGVSKRDTRPAACVQTICENKKTLERPESKDNDLESGGQNASRGLKRFMQSFSNPIASTVYGAEGRFFQALTPWPEAFGRCTSSRALSHFID
ncbi:hypothetical protein EVAR_63676_1 [Eumeta japonica]|uniref:Uncharacterized protein n=1 Tax=Eumeta variegata TaxID=151549 RepID=A0A4C1ZT83_EUMVA|nr:hypothetical protein EVAR_63676_1 [Eumeta japonica]